MTFFAFRAPLLAAALGLPAAMTGSAGFADVLPPAAPVAPPAPSSPPPANATPATPAPAKTTPATTAPAATGTPAPLPQAAAQPESGAGGKDAAARLIAAGIDPQALRGAEVVDAAGQDLGPISEFAIAAPQPVADGAPAAQVVEDPGSDLQGGKITHAIVDLGGFLGLGVHKVAVPLSALQISQPVGTDGKIGALRIVLPWTDQQLRSVPAFDPANGATLGLRASGEAGNDVGTAKAIAAEAQARKPAPPAPDKLTETLSAGLNPMARPPVPVSEPAARLPAQPAAAPGALPQPGELPGVMPEVPVPPATPET